jgi:hypothetical protein
MKVPPIKLPAFNFFDRHKGTKLVQFPFLFCFLFDDFLVARLEKQRENQLT